MGNEHSYMAGLQIDQKAVEVSDFFTHYSAFLTSIHPSNLSVFVGERLVGGSLWQTQTPLEKISKNLMIYRHPCILKYVSSWRKGSEFFLAVEDVKPLSHMLPTLNGLQVCIGLHSVLKALCFLHEKALVSHNNVCAASIYVTRDGRWKLGGMEYLCTFKELNWDYISKTRNSRYEKGIDPDEIKVLKTGKCRKDFIDVYAFGALAFEILKKVTDDEIASVSSFRTVCKNDLQNIDVNLRPKLVDLLECPFFNHDFIKIYSFLTELPLKTDEEKADFFTLLTEKLGGFNEIAVASQLGGLLLSRLVLLNKTAQKSLLPLILIPQTEKQDGLFSQEIFKKYMTPKLLEIFGVRDAEVRKLLLNFFSHYFQCFSTEELQSEVLPELLVGIKDTNDELVALTLRALAELVPLLGSDVVIGGKRAKLFTDGRPVLHSTKNHKQRAVQPHVEAAELIVLPERPQPDGEEVDTSTDEVEQSADDDLETWEDWDANENAVNEPLSSTESVSTSSPNNTEPDLLQTNAVTTPNYEVHRKKSLPDITELDIKNQKDGRENDDDVDFFQDMEPIIETKPRFAVAASENDKFLSEGVKKIGLNVAVVEESAEDGWGDEEWD